MSILGLAALLLLGGCREREAEMLEQIAGGDPDQGRHLIFSFACGSCHNIPGFSGANGTVGPPLGHFAARSYIAGSLTNNPSNLVRWIMEPQAIEPGTAMPDMGVSEAQARHIASYLYSLE